MSRHSSSISNFKKVIFFVWKAILLFCIVAAFCFRCIMPQYSGSYMASLVDKVHRLKSIEESKIVLIGNSNLAFGINSELIEEAMGVPVVNMGFHGGAGNIFHERMAKLNVKKGDIYILCPSYFGEEGEMDCVFIWSTIENHFELWDLLEFEDILPMFKAYPTYLKKCIDYWIDDAGNQTVASCYSRDAFNEYGDNVWERPMSIYTFENEVIAPEIADTTITRINELSDWLNERGATLLVAGYPIGKGELTDSVENFMMVQQELKEKLVCPFISDFKDYMFTYDMFYDTHLHLTDEGVRLRTEQLIEDLKTWQEKAMQYFSPE